MKSKINKVMLAILPTLANSSITASGKPRSILLVDITPPRGDSGRWTTVKPLCSVPAQQRRLLHGSNGDRDNGLHGGTLVVRHPEALRVIERHPEPGSVRFL